MAGAFLLREETEKKEMKIHLHSDWPPTASSTTDRQGGRSARERPGQEDEGGSHPTSHPNAVTFLGLRVPPCGVA